MAWKRGILFACCYLVILVAGELVFETIPTCPGDPALYRCSVTSSRLQWEFTTVSGAAISLSRISGRPQSEMQTQILQGVPITFNVLNISATYIDVVATVSDPHKLNGTLMVCDQARLTISITTMNLLPTTLAVSRTGNNISIVPNVPDDISGLQYQLSGSSLMEVTQPIIVNSSDNITFIRCLENITFTIDTCLLDDGGEERNYTLFLNGTWLISRSCGDILVNCINDEEWSTDISCQELPTSTPANTESNLPTSPSRPTPSRPTRPVAIWIGVPVGSVLAIVIFGLVVLVIVLLCKRIKRKKLSLEEMELNHLEEDSNEYSTLNHPTPSTSMPVDAYDTINSNFTARQPPEAPSYGMLNGNAATVRDRTQNRGQDRIQDRGRDEDHDRFQGRAQDTDSDTASHQYAKTKHIPQKSKSNDMMYSEVAMGDKATLHPHLTTGSGVQYSGIQHGVRPEDSNLNLDSLLIQLRPVTDRYQELGVAAGLSQETIEEITSHAAVAFDGLVEVCDAWIRSLRRQDTTPTWRAVSDMLQEIGQEKLARDLLKVYTTGALPVTVDMHTVEIPKQATQSPPPPVPQRNDVDMDDDGEVAMATVVSLKRDRMPTESEVPPPPIPPFHPNEDQAIAVPPRPPKKGAAQPGAPAIPPKILPPKPSPNPTPEAVPSLPPKPNKKA